jgi:hypothetical protein
VLRDDALQPVDASTHHYITRVLYALTFSLLVPHHSRLCIIVCTCLGEMMIGCALMVDILAKQQFHSEFYLLRIASLGAFIGEPS